MYEEKEIKYKKRTKEKKKRQNNKWIEKNKKIARPHPFLEKINWKQLGIKLFTLLIAMILIIFIISRINKYHKNQNMMIDNNMNKIINGTLIYYQTNPLPKNIGDSSSLILEEMINLNIVDKIKDDNDKYCDYLNSYIILTKTTEEYRLKIYLKCPQKEKTIEEKIICNAGICETKK